MFYFIYNYIRLFIFDFINRFNGLDSNILYDFIINNKIILFFICFTYMGIIVDSRFKLRNKILIFLGLFIFVVFSALAKSPLLAKRNPFIEESKHFHY